MEQRTAIVEGSAEPAQRRRGALASPWLQLARALGAGRIIALGLVACGLLGFFAYIVGRATDDPTPLFSGLALTDAQELVGRLEAMGTPYRLSPGGDAIMVPSGDALRLRMALAEEGMPVGGTVGYELSIVPIPSPPATFWQTSICGERSKGSLPGRSARCAAFARRACISSSPTVPCSAAPSGPTASIVLTLRGAEALDKRQIAGIRQLVAAAVPGLAPER